MDKERFVAVVLALIAGSMASVAIYSVLTRTEVVPKSTISECRLPCKCAPLYNLGTSEWRDCMGVGRK